MPRSPGEWHARFEQQAAWTEQVRGYLLGRMHLSAGERVLEVGCGTGAITARLNQATAGTIYGLDINTTFLRLAQRSDPETRFCAGDALRLPFASGSLAAAACHFVLLWLPDPGAALREMARVTRRGGAVAAFAEPDYGGRIDYPPALAELGQMQSAALRRQGAEPEMGRRLAGLFHEAGLTSVETGLLGGQWQGPPSPEQQESEWETLAADLEGQVAPERMAELRRVDAAAWAGGERVLFVPTFYAVGRKK